MPENPIQLSFPRRPLVIGIAGCSGSGKTTLARELAQELSATLLPLDLYYRDLAHLTLEERTRQNFDDPDSLEHTLLTQHVEALAAGQKIGAPLYDFTTHTRIPDRTLPIPVEDVVIIEGILALHYEDLRALYDVGIFVSAPSDVCLKRRIHRDIHERGRTEASVREQYWATAHPMAERYVLPSAAHASLTVDGCEALDWSVEQVLALLRRKGHLPRK
jgi:uridine kinase